MNVIVKQVSSLEKIRSCGIGDIDTVVHKTIMRGESFSYQIALETRENIELELFIDSEIKENIRLYEVKNVVMDFAANIDADNDYLTKESCLMPDILMPVEVNNANIRIVGEACAIWVTVDIPGDITPGEYSVKLSFVLSGEHELISEQIMKLDVINETVSNQKTIFTQWFYADCIADVHNVDIYSEEHWYLIDKYMALASSLGINMLLTPIITPPLDTKEGITRPCVQLIKIEKKNSEYIFDFSFLRRWIELCNKNSIEYFEFSHLFSQWGLKYAPNIMVTENGEERYMFGWHVKAQSPEYRAFLEQFVPALLDFCEGEGIKDRCWFHISDEPSTEHLEAYEYAYNLIKPLIGDCPVLDAISDYEFYEKGYIEYPVSSTDHIQNFIDHNVKNQWAYYCCGQGKNVGNRFIAMPSYRNRILGLQIYKYNIEGFLQWGYNFYNNRLSRKNINPYITTSADKAFPSGDPFSVYPIKNGVVPSLRAVIFKEALKDIEVCRKLEGYIGRENVIKMIDSAAGMNLTFSEYPRNSGFIPSLIEEMEIMIKTATE